MFFWYNRHMKQVDFSSMTKEELESFALDTSKKLDEVQQSLSTTKSCLEAVRLNALAKGAKKI